MALPLQLRNFLLDSFLLLVRHERVDELIATLEGPFILLSEQAFLYNQLLLRLLGQVPHVDFADLLILVVVLALWVSDVIQVCPRSGFEECAGALRV